MQVTTRRRMLLSAALAGALAACGGDPPPDGAPETPAEAASEARADRAETATASDTPGAAPVPAPLGLPADGQPGSLANMAAQPAATAALDNPNLQTLAGAVQTAGLADTLNGPGPFTVFAPVDQAFAAVAPAELQALLADPERLRTVLTYHVVQGEAVRVAGLSTRQEVGTTAPVALAPEGDTVTLNDGQATIVYPDIQVANGVVHLIDGVLMPSGA